MTKIWTLNEKVKKKTIEISTIGQIILNLISARKCWMSLKVDAYSRIAPISTLKYLKKQVKGKKCPSLKGNLREKKKPSCVYVNFKNWCKETVLYFKYLSDTQDLNLVANNKWFSLQYFEACQHLRESIILIK